MNRWIAILLALFPLIAAADSGSLSFTPPSYDYSVIFLADIFGVVDGVLHGTGTQIMGSIFSVFNAAVLALGGIIIMYTLLVSTMNTAHEGQMLGQKWSSIWVPVRSTLGLTLLVPKSSGYCLMQIFFMWVVVQGVGAADKVWNMALDYLNRGGVIMQAQENPANALLGPNYGAIPAGAQTILAGQVCMLGVQTLLEKKIKINQAMLQSGWGDCHKLPSDSPLAPFCALNTIPPFIDTVNFVGVQSQQPTATTFSVNMPNFDKSSIFAPMNGLCGTITWNGVASDAQMAHNLSPSESSTMLMSRAIALQQMYMDLATTAQVIIGNDPDFSGQTPSSTSAWASPIAVQPFGVPQTAEGVPCNDMTTPECILWGAEGGLGAPLFSGTEFRGALQDYNAVMMPVLTFQREESNPSQMNTDRDFIAKAEAKGWIMAGSYFMDLVSVNTAGSFASRATTGDTADTLVDTQSGLEKSTFSPSSVTPAQGVCDPSQKTYLLCLILGHKQAPALTLTIEKIIDGTTLVSSAIDPSDIGTPLKITLIDGFGASTVYGFTNNSMLLKLPGQPGLKRPNFSNMPKLDFQLNEPVSQPVLATGCPVSPSDSWIHQVVLYISCLVGFTTILNTTQNWISQQWYELKLDAIKVINGLLVALLQLPLQAIMVIFQNGVQLVSAPGVNPIVALSMMGTYFINFAATMWVLALPMALVVGLIPFIGAVLTPLLMIALPLFMAWLSIMLGIGFITAYYVPLIPYMIFTFGAVAWLMAVMEAMVAAPIVALGITHPEGHETFGKGEQAIMILMNIFLRPSMMVIGYIMGIALSYVGVWIINAGFDNAIKFIYNPDTQLPFWSSLVPGLTSFSGGYTFWTAVYGYFFAIIIYTTMYMTVVEKAFTLIAVVPDKVLRWIGGQPEQHGAEASQWAGEAKSKLGEASKETGGAIGQTTKQGGAQAMQVGASAIKALKGGKGGGGGGG